MPVEPSILPPWALALCAVFLCACSDARVAQDGGAVRRGDAGGHLDAAGFDSTSSDSPDAWRPDDGVQDGARTEDASQEDASQQDASQQDASQPDASQQDASQPDASLPYNILDGEGVGNIRVYVSTFADVEAEYGSNFVLTTPYAVLMTYQGLGLEFARRASETTVRLISFSAPFAGVTKRGIVLNQSTMLDVRSAYGPLAWRTTTGANHWWAEYDGIQFYVERDSSVPQFPLDEGLHIGRTIVKISVGLNSF